MKHKKCFFYVVLFFIHYYLISQDSQFIKDALSSIPKTSDSVLVYSHLVSKLQSVKSIKEEGQANIFLAEYASRSHLFKEAGNHYLKVFSLYNTLKEDNTKKYLIKALKSFIMAGDIESGYATYGKILAIKDEKPSKYDYEAELYIQYLHLAESLSDSKIEINLIIKKLKNYSKDKNFNQFRRSILLLLWFISDDAEAERILLKEYPKSIESMLVKGDVVIFPTTFWYLIPSINFNIEDEKSERTKPSSSVEVSLPKAYQIGFFKKKEYAITQQQKLTRKGFSVEIKEEKKDGTAVYYIVLVIEKENGMTGIKLKDAGFESFPIFD